MENRWIAILVLAAAGLQGWAQGYPENLTGTSFYDGVDFSASSDIATPAGVQTPVTSTSSGWQWGGFSAGTASIRVTTTQLVFDSNANKPGSYAYTLFSGADRSIDLSGIAATFKIQATAAANNQRIRWMVRDAAGNWFLSDEIWEDLSTRSDARHMRAFPVARMKWTQITNGAQLDSMGATATALSLGADGTPDLSDVSGFGVYVANSYIHQGLTINGVRVSEREALVYYHPGLASHWFEGFGGDLRVGMSDMAGACFNEAYWGGNDNIIGSLNGRQCQYAFRSQYHSGIWNPTQAGYAEYYGTPIPIRTATSSTGTGVRYEYGPWPISNWQGDGKMDACENEELTLGLPYADCVGWKNHPFADVDNFDDSQVTQAEEATSDFMQGGFVEDVSSVTEQEVLALRLNLYQDFVRIGHNTLQFNTNALHYDRERTATSEESIIREELFNADISPLLPGQQSSSPVDMTTIPYRWAARIDVNKANFRYMWVPDPDTGAWTVHDLLPTTDVFSAAQGQSFSILANSADTNLAGSCKAVMVYYPEWSDVNRFSIQGIRSETGEAVYQEDRRTLVTHSIYQTTSGGWTSDSPPISLKFSKQQLGISISGMLSTNATPEGIHERFRQEFFWVFGTPEETLDAVADLDAYYLAQNNNAPEFSDEPLAMNIRGGTSLSTNISSRVSDADGDDVTFFKVDGPDWVSVSTNGVIYGTPGKAHLGQNQILVSASDGEAIASKTVNIEVFDANRVWFEDFEGYELGTTNLVVIPDESTTVFDGTPVNQWVVGQGGKWDWQVEDAGSDRGLSLTTKGRDSQGVAICLDAEALGLLAGTEYKMTFSIAKLVKHVAGNETYDSFQFANVLKLKKVKGEGDDEGGSVTLDLQKAFGWDNTVSAGGALMATGGAYTNSIKPSANGATVFATNGDFSHAFSVADDDEYIMLTIGNVDDNDKTDFNLTKVSLVRTSTASGVSYDWLDGWYAGLTTAEDYENAAASDTDGDGQTAEQEYIANTSPTDSGSRFSVGSASPQGGAPGFVLNWNSQSGRVYSVWGTTNLMLPFEPWATNLVHPDASFTDTVHSAESGAFYKIRVEMQ